MNDALREQYQQVADYLSARDARLAPVIAREGLCDIVPHTNYYQDLVESIISQQLSVKAAASISKRFKALFNNEIPAPEAILATNIETLRSVGLSNQKANYIRDLASHVASGKVSFQHLPGLTNQEIIAELTDVKGIGEWTVHMFLMFCMGRLDVLPYGDLGIRNGIRALYNLDNVPSPKEITAIAEANHWHPYESIAAWYIWRSLDNKPK